MSLPRTHLVDQRVVQDVQAALAHDGHWLEVLWAIRSARGCPQRGAHRGRLLLAACPAADLGQQAQGQHRVALQRSVPGSSEPARGLLSAMGLPYPAPLQSRSEQITGRRGAWCLDCQLGKLAWHARGASDPCPIRCAVSQIAPAQPEAAARHTAMAHSLSEVQHCGGANRPGVLGLRGCSQLVSAAQGKQRMKRERSPEPAEAGDGAAKAARTSPEDTPQQAQPRRKPALKSGAECPYLDTISLQVRCWAPLPRAAAVAALTRAFAQNLDFDFEKFCSVSLSPVNVYACLVCGKYFQVRCLHARLAAAQCDIQLCKAVSGGDRRSSEHACCRAGGCTRMPSRTPWSGTTTSS